MTKDSASARITPFRAWWAVFVLFLAYMFSYLDRYILGLLVGPLKRDLQINDTQVSLLGGAAFAIFFAIMGLVMARYSDRGSRRLIIAFGVAGWSLATMVCGLAQNYWQLFLARMGVGAGEAVLSPAAISLVADLFPKETRGFALGFFMTANHIGGALAVMIGGSVVLWLENVPPVETWFGPLHSWQLVFVALGIPGFLVAMLSLTMPEPRRDLSEKVDDAPMSEFMAYVMRNKGMLSAIFIIFAMSGAMNFAFNLWSPAFFIRHHGLNTAQIGLALGLPILIFAPTGGLIAGWLLRHWTKKGRDDAPLLVAMVAFATNWPFSILIPLMPDATSALVVNAIACIFDGMVWVSATAAMQLMTPANMRARVGALYFFCVSIIALMIGPTVVGLLTDYVYQDPKQVGLSLLTVAAFFGPVISLALPFTLKAYRRVVQETAAAA